MTRRAPVLIACLAAASTLPHAARAEDSYTVQTVLLLASTTGPSNLEGVPRNVVDALQDVAQLLPYKNFRMIDASILRSSGEASGRLTGADGREFELGFQFRPGEEGTLAVRQFEIETLIPQPQDRVVMDSNGNSRIEHQPPSWVRKSVIATSFTVKVGETIVVGSSKLNGSGEALVVLFTALR